MHELFLFIAISSHHEQTIFVYSWWSFARITDIRRFEKGKAGLVNGTRVSTHTTTKD